MVTTFYLLHGDDDLSLSETLAHLRAEMGDSTEADMNISEFDGQAASAAEVLNAAMSYPFLADKRMVIVRGMIGWITRKGAGQTGKDAVERLTATLPELPEYARLIFAERETLSDKNPLVKLAAAHESGFVKAFTAPKDSRTWIEKRAKSAHSARIEPAAVAALALVIGDDLRRADNELAKLAAYVGDGETITEADVAALTPYVPEADVFKMVDALANGRGGVALDLLHKLMREKDQDAFKLFGMIVRQFRMLLQAREHLDSGGSAGDLARVLKCHPYTAKKVGEQVRSFAFDDLQRVYRRLQDADFRMKTGQIAPELALDLFVVGLAR